MATRILVGVVALFFAGASLSEEPKVLRIRKEYQSIQRALPHLKAESVQFSKSPMEVIEVNAFRDNKGNIQLIKVQLTLESKKVLEEFYYQYGALIFAFSQSYPYDLSFYGTPEDAKKIGSKSSDSEKTQVMENRYYFDQGRMILWLNENKIAVQSKSKEFKDSEKKIAARSNEMLSKFLVRTSFPEDPIVLRIRKEYQSIQSALPYLKAESLKLFEYPTEGGEAHAFRDSKGNIRLIKVQLTLESKKLFEEFYYEHGTLIFAFFQNHQYNVPFYVTPEDAKESGGESFDPEKTHITENRYYFDQGKMFRWLNENKIAVKSNSEEFKDSEKEIMKTSSEMLSKFKNTPKHLSD